MSKEIYIFGAGGHTRALLSLLNLNGYEILGIYDESFNPNVNERINSIDLIGNYSHFKNDKAIVLSIGDNSKRKRLYESFQNHIYKQNVFHPTCFIDETAVLESSNFIFANVVLNTNVKIGRNNIINTGAIIEHEVKIGSHNHISVGSIICGRSTIGNNCFLGAGTVVNDKVNICDNVVIGSNSTVIKSVLEPGVYVGNPLRKIK